MKSRNPKVYKASLACLTFTIMTLGLTLMSCDTGAGAKPSCVVEFDYGEGGGTPPSYITVDQDSYTTLPDQQDMTPPTGKVLSGWKDPNNQYTYNPRTDYKVISDVKLTAQWRDSKAPVYTVTFGLNGGNGVAPASIGNAVPGNVITLPDQGHMLAPAAKAFDGWSVNGNPYPARALYLITTSNITINARWKDSGNPAPSVTYYTVIFDRTGGNGSPPSPITVEAGKSITIPGQGGMTASGLTFSGWSPDPEDDDAPVYIPGESFTPTGSITLYAWWTIAIYTVTFNANGGTNAPPAQTVEAGESITLPDQGNMRYGDRTFGYVWCTSSSGTGTVYECGYSFTPTRNITFYAIWYEDDNTPGNGTPDKPTGLTITAISSTSILLSWDAVDGATSYNVYHRSSDSSIYDFVGDTKSTNFIDTGLTPATAYYYRVSAVNRAGESDAVGPAKPVSTF